MRILSRYFALRFLGLFAAFLFVSTLAIVVVEMLAVILAAGELVVLDHGAHRTIKNQDSLGKTLKENRAVV